MRFESRTLELKDGRTCVLRPACPDDAGEMIEYLKITAGETPFLLRYPDEVNYTLEEEKEILEGMLKDEHAFMMAAVVDGKIAGNCSVSGMGEKRRICHRCAFAIALKKEFWGLGTGTGMIGYAMELAKQAGYEQIELVVADGNDRARKLYEKAGFVETGKHLRALKYDDGTYCDEYIMSKVL